MATSGITITSTRTSPLLDPERFHEEHVERQREEIVKKWDELGFLDGLKGHVKENIAQLYCCQASTLINEEVTPLPKSSFESVQFPIVRSVMGKWIKQEEELKNKLVINKLRKHKL